MALCKTQEDLNEAIEKRASTICLPPGVWVVEYVSLDWPCHLILDGSLGLGWVELRHNNVMLINGASSTDIYRSPIRVKGGRRDIYINRPDDADIRGGYVQWP